MIQDNEEQVGTARLSPRRAIALAMEGRWREAVVANRTILESIPGDVDALNRLGRAHMELHEYNEARIAYRRAKEVDPYNSIADKNLKRLATLKTESADEIPPKEDDRPVEPRYFIEETGKAGVVRLVNLAPRQVLAKMVAGDRVALEMSDGNLVATDDAGAVLGWVEPKHGQRLARLMAGGNRYLASVVSASETGLSLMIREIYQDASQAGQLSFPSRGMDSFRPYVSEKSFRSHMEYEEEPAEDLGFGAGEEEITEEAPPEDVEALEEEGG
ncbi:MAG: tetratricopeptide repeat protein [Dehalococcoidia bacterium]|nr:tetratricopeptide repeat protein [Dehalococcoidia bacterium]